MEQRILILGHGGMLGYIVTMYFKSIGIKCDKLYHRHPSYNFENLVSSHDVIINCIGNIPQKHDEFGINFELPIALERLSKTGCKIIHPGSDCENDDTPYGKSKKSASDWIKTHGIKTKIIKTSIIGPKPFSTDGLLEWFLSQKNEAKGYSKCYWNGITTLEWAKRCHDMVKNWDDYGKENIFHSKCISKYNLLEIIKYVFEKQIDIKKTDTPSKNRCLFGGIETEPISHQLIELKQFMKEQTWISLYQ